MGSIANMDAPHLTGYCAKTADQSGFSVSIEFAAPAGAADPGPLGWSAAASGALAEIFAPARVVRSALSD